jgi:monoamine oxidase
MHRLLLQRWLRLALARPEGEPAAAPNASRRSFIAGAASVAGLAACGPRVRRLAVGAQPKIAILGAGLAGLAAARRLKARGLVATLYEARNRVGGRVVSDRSFGTHDGGARAVECGAEFIDTQHRRMLALAQTYQLPLLDMTTLPVRKRTFLLQGQRYDEAAIVAMFAPIATALRQEWTRLGQSVASIGMSNATPVARALDGESLDAFVVRSGASETARRLVAAAYGTEFGLATGDQSALNLFAMLDDSDLRAAETSGVLSLFGASDERFKVLGGNDRIPAAMAAELTEAIETGRACTAIRQRPDLRFELIFDGAPTVVVDLLICTLPFPVLRQLDVQVPMRAAKRLAIDTLGYGTNAKRIVPFAAPLWEAAGDDGSVFGEGELESVWAPLTGQGSGPVALTQFLAGRAGAELDRTTPEAPFLAAVDALWPGLAAQRDERPALVFPWARDRWAGGSYACYRPGQWTAFGGVEAEIEGEGRMFFAGEHVSSEFQGFMEGAVETGEAAADMIANALI